jgi:hypothetical protein
LIIVPPSLAVVVVEVALTVILMAAVAALVVAVEGEVRCLQFLEAAVVEFFYSCSAGRKRHCLHKAIAQ